MRPVKTWLRATRDRFFGDPAGLVELISSLCLLAWAEFIWFNPQILVRDSYAGFQILPAQWWVAIMAMVGIGQIAANFAHHRLRHDWRFLAMCFASGLWFAIATTFFASEVSTTAERTYLILAAVTAVAAIWLSWKASPKS